MDNMTALVSAFARAYHYENNDAWVFADAFARKMLTEGEYAAISRNMSQGIAFFAPDFKGTPEEALRCIVDHQLAPSVLARSAFCERAIKNAVRIGSRQIVVYACGYETFSLRTRDRNLSVFELDLPEMIEDRRNRMAGNGLEPACHVTYIGCDLSRPSWKDALVDAGFDPEQPSFGSLLGISYYLSKDAFRQFITAVASVTCEGASICFDYPTTEDGTESARNRKLAAAAGEAMKARYSCGELEALLAEAGFLIREHMDADEATDTFFEEYNRRNPAHGMAAPKGVGYCLAVKKGGLPSLMGSEPDH